ncbi:serine/threonine-protein kinase mos [Parasteatoda tepidariorum]|uniref:serine/threonine-protein kinase mos n=1 Tax=Parasteatoda tepidariorum TaxID=114398 RepID=UPI00077FAB61|nr:serine/threonine-protein kinase mos [Parasteatoda tepidariorum]
MAAMRFMPSPSSGMLQSSNGDLRVNLQTTPKLPKRERLASFSRLIASENFKELRPEKIEARKNIRRSFKKLNWNIEDLPDVRISPSSPASATQDQFGVMSKIKEAGNSGFLSLPFSPKLNLSLKYESPTYKQPTPMRSPLYAFERKGVFLGRGSFGNVTLCTYKGSKIALKVIHDKTTFIGERNFINIRHPHLVSILHITTLLDKVFICMEFAGQCNLQQILDTKSELDFPRRLSFTIQIALGLRHCHQRRIVHGDVKPANVIVSPFGVCKLGDFGHSFKLDSFVNNLWMQNEDVIGTAFYAAPEVLRGASPTLFSDIYSFGILLWQVHTRELPFAGEHPHVIIYKVAHYGFRPMFQAPSCDAYEETAKCCWSEEPSLRLNIAAVIHKLQEIKKNVQKCVTK